MTSEQILGRLEITVEDLVRVREYGAVIAPKSSLFIEKFYGWLQRQPEYEQFFQSEVKLAEVQAAEEVYWRQFFTAKIDDDYVESRRKVGFAHARIGLPLPAYISSVNQAMKIITESLYDGGLSDGQYAAAVKSVAKLIYLDVMIVVDAFNTRTNQLIAEQADAMLAMSTPVTEIWNDILMLPIVGIIDSKRAQEIMTAVLSKISETYALRDDDDPGHQRGGDRRYRRCQPSHQDNEGDTVDGVPLDHFRVVTGDRANDRRTRH